MKIKTQIEKAVLFGKNTTLNNTTLSYVVGI